MCCGFSASPRGCASSSRAWPSPPRSAQLAERVRIPRALVSHHLRLLRASRLLRSERHGKQVIYAPLDERVRCIVVDLAQHVVRKPEREDED